MSGFNLKLGDTVRMNIDGKRRQGRVCGLTPCTVLIVSGLDAIRFNRKSLERRGVPRDRIIVDGVVAGRHSPPQKAKKKQQANRVDTVNTYRWQEGVQG